MASQNRTPLSPPEVQRWTSIGVLSALSLLLGYVESFIPIPIPGVKLGLANIPILVALACGDLWGAFFVGMVKVVATGLLFGNPVTFAYSLVGTLLAYALMAPLSRLRTMRLEMVSIVGALAHETGQLLVAQVLLGTPLVWYSAPLLAVAGCVTGLLCGIVAGKTALLLEEVDTSPTDTEGCADSPLAEASIDEAEHDSSLVFETIVYVAFLIVVLHTDKLGLSAVCFGLTAITAVAAHVPARTVRMALAPTLPLALITFLAQVASIQRGTILCTLGPVTLTREALETSILMLSRLGSVTLASVALVALVGRDGLARCAQQALRPLEALGMSTSGPQLALSTTLQLIPALSSTFGEDLHPRDVWKRSFWAERLPLLVRSLYAQALIESASTGPTS